MAMLQDSPLSKVFTAEPLPPRQACFEAKVHRVLTEDGLALTVKHYPPSTGTSHRCPVILMHGLGGNSQGFDMTRERSLAYILSQEGYHVYLPDLRGSGLSERPKCASMWTLQAYIHMDAPAIVRFVQEAHGGKPVHWLGHSLGGWLILCALASQTVPVAAIKSVTTLASALQYGDSAWRHLVPLLPLMQAASFSSSSSSSAVEQMPSTQSPSFFLALTLRFYPGFLSQDLENLLVKSLEASLEPVSLGVMRQLATSVTPTGLEIPIESKQQDEEDEAKQDDRVDAQHYGQAEKASSCRPRRGSYIDLMPSVDVPVLAIAGSHDVQCTPDAVFGTLHALGSSRKRYLCVGKETGGAADYGHLDLLLSRHAPQDVYPPVLDWMDEIEAVDAGEDALLSSC